MTGGVILIRNRLDFRFQFKILLNLRKEFSDKRPLNIRGRLAVAETLEQTSVQFCSKDDSVEVIKAYDLCRLLHLLLPVGDGNQFPKVCVPEGEECLASVIV